MFCRLKKKNATCAFQCFFRIQSAFGCLNLYISLWPWNPRIEIGLVNAVVKYRTTAWPCVAGVRRKRKGILGGKETRGRGGGWGGRDGRKGLQVGHYFHVINIHQAHVKINPDWSVFKTCQSRPWYLLIRLVEINIVTADLSVIILKYVVREV